MICPRCTKNTDGVHTCTPTDEWRNLESENAALRTQIDDIKGSLAYRNSLFCRIEDERNELRQQLAASQARELQLREALEQVMDDIRSESYLFAGANGISVVTEALANKTLALPSDTTALEAIVKKAGEVMRERCIKATIEMIQLEVTLPAVRNEIRALPAVTLDDLKGGEA